MTRRLGKTRNRVATTLNDMDFLRMCRSETLTPLFLRAKRHINTTKAQRIYDKMEGAMLRERIGAYRFRLWQLKKEGETLEKELEAVMDEELWLTVDRITKEQAERIRSLNAKKKEKKWHKLIDGTTTELRKRKAAPKKAPNSNGPLKGHQKAFGPSLPMRTKDEEVRGDPKNEGHKIGRSYKATDRYGDTIRSRMTEAALPAESRGDTDERRTPIGPEEGDILIGRGEAPACLLKPSGRRAPAQMSPAGSSNRMPKTDKHEEPAAGQSHEMTGKIPGEAAEPQTYKERTSGLGSSEMKASGPLRIMKQPRRGPTDHQNGREDEPQDPAYSGSKNGPSQSQCSFLNDINAPSKGSLSFLFPNGSFKNHLSFLNKGSSQDHQSPANRANSNGPFQDQHSPTLRAFSNGPFQGHHSPDASGVEDGPHLSTSSQLSNQVMNKESPSKRGPKVDALIRAFEQMTQVNHSPTTICKGTKERMNKGRREVEVPNDRKTRTARQPGHSRSTTDDRLVINLSSYKPPADVMDVLKKGLNFAVTPSRLPSEELVTCIEAALEGVPQNAADEIRLEAAFAIKRARIPTENITKSQRRGLNELRRNESVVVTRADKGNATVLLDRTLYEEKMEALLDPLLYEKGIKDPTRAIEMKIKKILKNSGLEKKLVKEMEPDDPRTPRIYGLPKVHKAGMPFRPIVSMIGAPTYRPSKVLARMLKPHAGNTSSYVKNSTHLVELLKDLRVENGDQLVSFDVESLFTNVPVKESVELVEKKKWLEGDLLELFKLCLSSCYFQFKNIVYKQRDGVAMGSPLSSVVANLFMEDLEERAIADYPLKPKLWLRYVDDVFAIWPHGTEQLRRFMDHLNNRHPSIRFTMEEEVQGKLPFLDLLIMKREDGKLAHTVYCKPTATGRYLHASSHHHPAQKKGVIKTLVHRAFRLCSHPEYLEEELQRLTDELAGNGYRRWEVRSTIKQVRRTNNGEERMAREKAERTVALPYVKGVSEKVGKWLTRHGMDVAYKPLNKLSELMKSTKDHQWLQDRGVYLLPCDCGSVYVGQTGKKVATRIGQHTADYKHGRAKTSAVAKHGSMCSGQMLFDQVTILAREENRSRRLVREAVEILKRPRNFNNDDGYSLPAVWRPLLKKTNSPRSQVIGPREQDEGRQPLAGDKEPIPEEIYKGSRQACERSQLPQTVKRKEPRTT